MSTQTRAGSLRIKCQGPGCGKTFQARTSRAKFCSPSCRSRARRRGAAEVEHELVKAVRSDLRQAGKLGSYVGQSAVRIAEQLAASGPTGAAALSKELDRLMRLALGEPAGVPAAPVGEGHEAPVEQEDELDRARQARDAKAAAMAAEA